MSELQRSLRPAFSSGELSKASEMVSLVINTGAGYGRVVIHIENGRIDSFEALCVVKNVEKPVNGRVQQSA